MHGLPVGTDSGPPLGLPLRFFLAGLAFLVTATVVGVLDAAGLMPGLSSVAHAHLLLAGWACLTIMGAMAQFVPTWSGGRLRWRRLIEAAFPLVALGIGGLVVGLSTETLLVLPIAGSIAAVGFWLFVAAMARTLVAVRPGDVTEAHVALAIAYLAVVPGRFLGTPPIARGGVVLATVGLVAFAVVLARRLVGATVDYTPIHSRYGVVAATLLGWAVVGAPQTFADPLQRAMLFGGTSGRWILLLGVVAFTILGTLYHVIPFLVWLRDAGPLRGGSGRSSSVTRRRRHCGTSGVFVR